MCIEIHFCVYIRILITLALPFFPFCINNLILHIGNKHEMKPSLYVHTCICVCTYIHTSACTYKTNITVSLGTTSESFFFANGIFRVRAECCSCLALTLWPVAVLVELVLALSAVAGATNAAEEDCWVYWEAACRWEVRCSNWSYPSVMSI